MIWKCFSFGYKSVYSNRHRWSEEEKFRKSNAHHRLIADYVEKQHTKKSDSNRRWKASWNLDRGQMVSVKTFYVVFESLFFSLLVGPSCEMRSFFYI